MSESIPKRLGRWTVKTGVACLKYLALGMLAALACQIQGGDIRPIDRLMVTLLVFLVARAD